MVRTPHLQRVTGHATHPTTRTASKVGLCGSVARGAVPPLVARALAIDTRAAGATVLVEATVVDGRARRTSSSLSFIHGASLACSHHGGQATLVNNSRWRGTSAGASALTGSKWPGGVACWAHEARVAHTPAVQAHTTGTTAILRAAVVGGSALGTAVRFLTITSACEGGQTDAATQG